jgi:AcrR family transcriptional regulator
MTDTAVPRAYHHGDLRASLIRAGAQLLDVQGYDVLSLRQVAAHAGVSHNAPYRHFADRRALLSAIALEGFQTLADGQLATAPGSADDELVQAARFHLRFALTRVGMYRLMFTSDILVGNADPEIGAVSMNAYRVLEARVKRVIDGHAHADAVASIVYAQLHGLALLLIEQRIRPWMRDGIDDERLADASATSIPAMARAVALALSL